MSSGDFSGQATTPQPFDFSALMAGVGEGALNDAEMNFSEWAQLPLTLTEYGLSILISRLVELGHKTMTVGDLAKELGILHEDGSWT